jgi:hypothetical protein
LQTIKCYKAYIAGEGEEKGTLVKVTETNFKEIGGGSPFGADIL